MSDVEYRQEASTLSLSLSAEYALGEKIKPFAELGLAYYKTKAEIDVTYGDGETINLASARDSGVSGVAGVGLIYQYNSNLGISLGWQRYFGLGESDTITDVGNVELDFVTYDAEVDYRYLSISYSY